MRQRGAFAALLLAGVLAISGAPWAEEPDVSSVHPPKHLKLVGDHWTAWDSPEPAPDDYIIQKGDTLWDLAGKWLDDPFLWPQVWDENRYILDSHWIYPGDPLVVPGRSTVVPPEGRLPVVEVVEPVLSGDADMAIAAFGPARRGGFGTVVRMARRGIKNLCGVEMRSPLSGQRAVRREILDRIASFDDGYGADVGLTLDALSAGARVIEVPVQMAHREMGKGLRGFLHRARQLRDVRAALGKRAKRSQRV